MSRTDREDAIAKALDILPPGDGARSDPRLTRDAELTEEARLTRETAADVWLAVSPLRAAPPDVLHNVMAKIDAKPAAVAKARRFTPWLAASGWAAAIAVAMSLWPQARQEGSLQIAFTKDRPAEEPKEGTPHAPESPKNPRPPEQDRNEQRLRNELKNLRSSLARMNSEASLNAPRVMSLSSPGAVERTPEEARERVWAILTGALWSALEAESGAPNDPAALVIERGWLPDGVAVPEPGEFIRHRNFPETSWQDLGLLKSDEGTYYDPAKNLIWAREGEGRSFIARLATGQDNLASYKPAEEEPAIAANQTRSQAEGFVIEDPVNDTAQIMVDQVPPLTEGNERYVVWTDKTGKQNRMPVASLNALNSAANTPFSPTGTFSGANIIGSTAQGILSDTLFMTIPGTGGLQSFQLIESPIVADGSFRVIVQGGK